MNDYRQSTAQEREDESRRIASAGPSNKELAEMAPMLTGKKFVKLTPGDWASVMSQEPGSVYMVVDPSSEGKRDFSPQVTGGEKPIGREGGIESEDTKAVKQAYRNVAHDLYHVDGDLEFDYDARVSMDNELEDTGAWVECWKWVEK